MLGEHVGGEFVQPVFVLAEHFGDAGDGEDIADRRHRSGRPGDCDIARFPIPRHQLVEFLNGMIGDAGEHVGEPCLGIDVVHLRRLCRPPNYAERVRYDASL